ncbi:hypothetical protein ABVK25_011352 [Lepraria finkii]|uniref:Uncharacterized protein n=1 Tax=Lepraria finkii TaxID=1340010 RepID=A0ABR4APY6_9LECA
MRPPSTQCLSKWTRHLLSVNTAQIWRHLKRFAVTFTGIYSFLDKKFRTASVAASHLAGLDNFEVQRGVGGHGVAGALRNGPGSTFLLRADMGALPHLENTSRNMQVPRSRKITKGN